MGNSLTLDDIMADPTRFGMPTFDEFSKNPDKYKSRADDLLEKADVGSVNLKNIVRKYKYQVFGFDCDSLERVERIMKEEGHISTDFNMVPEIIPCGQNKCEILVKFELKQQSSLIKG